MNAKTNFQNQNNFQILFMKKGKNLHLYKILEFENKRKLRKLSTKKKQFFL